MAKLANAKHVATTLLLSTLLTACGGSSDGGDDGELQCTAPQELNSAGTACITPETPVTNTAPSITSGTTISVTEGDANGSDVYTGTATDAEGDALSWAISDPQNIFTINTTTGVISIADNTNLVAADLTSYQITVSVADAEFSVNETITVTVEADNSNASPTPVITPTDSQAAIFYYREDRDYTGWTIHAWNNETCAGYADFAADGGTEWSAGLASDGTDENYGAYWLINTTTDASCLNYIIHKGDSKDPNDGDQKLTLGDSRWNFVVSGNGIYDDTNDISFEVPFTIENASAHLIDSATIVWNGSAATNLYLVSSSAGDLDSGLSITDDNSIEFTTATLTTAQ